ncbi:MAG TPA: lysophospholipid acyltransferase family protein [Pelomicrobium sp.]|nr:lysophospholipid acyltransferase family protein [Pelomicrobium sp.]
MRTFRRWSLQLLAIAGVRLTVRGDPPGVDPRSGIVVANHVSWLDIFVIAAVSPSRFVSKSEVRDWPLAGYLATRAGTVYLERARRRDAARVNQHMQELLRGGERLAVFPEGTTTDGTLVKPFHGSLLQPAVEAGAPVFPAALRYLDGDGERSQAAPYTGDDTFMTSLRRILAAPGIRAELTFLAPIATAGRTRNDVARDAEAAIASALRLPAPRSRPETPADPPAAAP